MSGTNPYPPGPYRAPNWIPGYIPSAAEWNRWWSIKADSGDLGAGYVQLNGSTMTGPLILSGDPTSMLGAATKQYVDTKVGQVGPNYLPLTGGTITGNLGVTGAIFIGAPAVNDFIMHYQTSDGQRVLQWGGPSEWQDLLEASSNTRRIWNANNGSVIGWSTSGDQFYYKYGAHGFAFSWDGNFVYSFVDGTDVGQLATVAWVQANFSSGSGPPTGALPITGGTITGNLGVTGELLIGSPHVTDFVMNYQTSNGQRILQWGGPSEWQDYLDPATNTRKMWNVTNGDVFTLDPTGGLTVNNLGVGGTITTGSIHVTGGGIIGSVAAGGNGVIYSSYHATNAFAFQSQPGFIYGYMNGSAVGSLVPPSTMNIKEDIAPSSYDCLSAVLHTPLYAFRYQDTDVTKPVGFIAERQYEVSPESTLMLDGKPFGIDVMTALATLYGAVQQLAERISPASKV